MRREQRLPGLAGRARRCHAARRRDAAPGRRSPRRQPGRGYLRRQRSSLLRPVQRGRRGGRGSDSGSGGGRRRQRTGLEAVEARDALDAARRAVEGQVLHGAHVAVRHAQVLLLLAAGAVPPARAAAALRAARGAAAVAGGGGCAGGAGASGTAFVGRATTAKVRRGRMGVAVSALGRLRHERRALPGAEHAGGAVAAPTELLLLQEVGHGLVAADADVRHQEGEVLEEGPHHLHQGGLRDELHHLRRVDELLLGRHLLHQLDHRRGGRRRPRPVRACLVVEGPRHHRRAAAARRRRGLLRRL
mmetsp:Transcript_48321/g.149090  ORF Transcript_48321/g.149090 Transcript_48321/m.149090 type:complete len:303 (+) Transcript_48321:360-1268(+)